MILYCPITVPMEGIESFTIKANADQCAAIAAQLGVVSVTAFQAEVTLDPRRRGLHCSGYWQAEWQDRCGISNEILNLDLNEELNVYLHWNEPDSMPDNADFIELDGADQFDLATLLIEYFSLAMPDYPRAPEVTFDGDNDEDTPINEEPKTKPFAGLADLLKNQ